MTGVYHVVIAGHTHAMVLWPDTRPRQPGLGFEALYAPDTSRMQILVFLFLPFPVLDFPCTASGFDLMSTLTREISHRDNPDFPYQGVGQEGRVVYFVRADRFFI